MALQPSLRESYGRNLETLNLVSETHLTLLVEVQSILNSRPLTPVTMDPEADVPLTPIPLILLCESPTLPHGTFKRQVATGKSSRVIPRPSKSRTPSLVKTSLSAHSFCH